MKEQEKFECADCGCFYWVEDRDIFECPNCEFEIGDRVQVIEQESIIGTIIRKDKNKNVVLDDDNSWCEENEEATLIYKDYELIKIK